MTLHPLGTDTNRLALEGRIAWLRPWTVFVLASAAALVGALAGAAAWSMRVPGQDADGRPLARLAGLAGHGAAADGSTADRAAIGGAAGAACGLLLVGVPLAARALFAVRKGMALARKRTRERLADEMERVVGQARVPPGQAPAGSGE